MTSQLVRFSTFPNIYPFRFHDTATFVSHRLIASLTERLYHRLSHWPSEPNQMSKFAQSSQNCVAQTCRPMVPLHTMYDCIRVLLPVWWITDPLALMQGKQPLTNCKCMYPCQLPHTLSSQPRTSLFVLLHLHILSLLPSLLFSEKVLDSAMSSSKTDKPQKEYLHTVYKPKAEGPLPRHLIEYLRNLGHYSTMLTWKALYSYTA